MSSPTAENFELRPIRDESDALNIVHIRNSGAEFLTHDTSLKSDQEQLDWYYDIYRLEHKNGNMIAYIGHIGLQAVAYGMIAHKDGEYWLTGVIAPDQRGKGLGRALFEGLASEVAKLGADRIMLDVQRDNTAARGLYEKLGYKYIANDSDYAILVMIGEVPDVLQKN